MLGYDSGLKILKYPQLSLYLKVTIVIGY